MRTVALNYFWSSEFLNTLQIVGSTSIPYIVLMSKTGVSLEGVLTFVFMGVIGGIVKAKKDLQANPNLYTPVGVLGTDPKEARLYAAQNVAVQKATEQVIPQAANDRINEVANDILNSVPVSDLLKPVITRTATDFLGRLFK